MKTAICVIEINNERFISPSLTEANYYLIVDSETESIQDKLLNSHSMNNDGSEIFCSQLLISQGVNKVIWGYCEHDAKRLFNDTNVDIIENLFDIFEEYPVELKLGINFGNLEKLHKVVSSKNNCCKN